MTFRRWLVLQTDLADPVGDIASDVAQDWAEECLRATSYNGIHRHIVEKHDAIDAAVEALFLAYRRYSAK